MLLIIAVNIRLGEMTDSDKRFRLLKKLERVLYDRPLGKARPRKVN
jgi:hypothetical protein